ncbi:28S ribosomal protein S21, mitochondrial isoform X3 [Apteryx rowi]|nr:28S ribosomal protein S21, mitochondrial isoform X3 [Apteryx rowi]XP_025941537.1 28S ribosomal protein S21, mitochondrial isoform X3 [Apteryx rowi]
MANHLRFIGRTVMVQNGNVEAAYGALNRRVGAGPRGARRRSGPAGRGLRILSHDGIIDDVKRRRYYEKPCRRRQRLAYEACRRVYNAEMARKLAFVSRKNRQDPWLGC